MKILMMKVAAIAMLFGATHAQTPICKLTNDCKCVPSVTTNAIFRPDCVRSITLVAPTAADNGCCKDLGANPLCSVTHGCSYELCAYVDMKVPQGCDSHNWSWDDGGQLDCTDKTGDGTACAGADFPACSDNSGKSLYLYDTWDCGASEVMWNASWTCVDNPDHPCGG